VTLVCGLNRITKWLFESPSFHGQMTHIFFNAQGSHFDCQRRFRACNYLFSRCFLFVFRITRYRFFLYSVLCKVAVDSLVVQHWRNNKTVTAKRRRVTADQLLSSLRNITDNESDCEDSGSESDDLHSLDLVSDSSFSDESEQSCLRSFNSGPGLRDHPPKRPRFQNQLETIIDPQEMDDIRTR